MIHVLELRGVSGVEEAMDRKRATKGRTRQTALKKGREVAKGTVTDSANLLKPGRQCVDWRTVVPR